MKKTKGIRVTGRSGSSIERTAHNVRALLLGRAPSSTPINGLELFEFELEKHATKLTGGVRVVVAVQDLPSNIEGYTQFDARKNCFFMTLSEESYARLVNEESRGLFTLCHELGHLALHCGEMKRLGALPHRELMLERSQTSHPTYADSEWQANRFASAILMPARGLETLRLQNRLDEDEVSRIYLTSYEASGIRIREFNAKRTELLRVSK